MFIYIYPQWEDKIKNYRGFHVLKCNTIQYLRISRKTPVTGDKIYARPKTSTRQKILVTPADFKVLRN